MYTGTPSANGLIDMVVTFYDWKLEILTTEPTRTCYVPDATSYIGKHRLHLQLSILIEKLSKLGFGKNMRQLRRPEKMNLTCSGLHRCRTPCLKVFKCARNARYTKILYGPVEL